MGYPYMRWSSSCRCSTRNSFNPVFDTSIYHNNQCHRIRMFNPSLLLHRLRPFHWLFPHQYSDPFPNALPLNSAYHIENTLNNLRYPPEPYPNQSISTKNDVSIQIKRVALWDSYTVQTPTKYQTVGPSAGKKFVIVIVEVTNYAGNEIIISPYPSNFELLYNGSHFLPTEIEYPVQAASISYKSESIGRNEQTGGALVYEVPSSLTLNQSYIRLLYLENDEKNPVWHLK